MVIKAAQKGSYFGTSRGVLFLRITVIQLSDAVDQKLDSIAQQNLTFFDSLRALANASEELQKESRTGIINNRSILSFDVFL